MRENAGGPPHSHDPCCVAVPLTEDLRAFVRAAQRPGSLQRAALVGAEAAPAGGELSEGAALTALLEFGRRAADDRVLADSYDRIAAEQNDEDRAVHAALRARNRFSHRAAE